MAQLTWRNVDAPNFSGSVEALRLAGSSLAHGLTASRQAIDAFQRDQTQSESARLMAAAMGARNPGELSGIVGQFNPSYLSPDALKFVAGRPQDIATLDQTRASTAGTQASTDQTRAITDFTRQATPMKVEGLRLGNASTAIANAAAGTNLNQTLWSNANTRREYEAAGPWNARLAEMRTLAGIGDETSRARLLALQGDPETARLATAAGVKDVSAVLNGNNVASSDAIKIRDGYGQLAENERKRTLGTTADNYVTALLQSQGSLASAQRALQDDQNIGSELKTAVSERLQKAGQANLFPAPAGESEVRINAALPGAPGLASQALAQAATPGQGFVTYRNQGAIRNQELQPRLVEAMNFLPRLGVTMEVTSGGQDGVGEGDRRTGSTRHDHGGAGDVRFMRDGRALSWENTQDVPLLQEIVRQARSNGVTGIGAGPGYMNPTTTHIGFGREAVWGAKGGQPYQALSDAVRGDAAGRRVTAALTSANGNPGQPFVIQTPAQPQIQLGPAGGIAAPAFVPGARTDTFDTLLSQGRTVSSALSAANDVSTLDNAFNPMAAVANAFTNRTPEQRNLKSAEVAANLKKEIGDDNNGGLLGIGRSLTIGQLTNDVNRVMNKFNLDADMAGQMIKNAINFEPGWIRDNRSVDHAAIDKHIGRFIETDGPNKGKPRTEVLNVVRQKAAIEKQITDAQTLLESAKQEYLTAENARQRGNSRVDVATPRARYEVVQRQIDALISRLRANPNLTANTASQTGR